MNIQKTLNTQNHFSLACLLIEQPHLDLFNKQFSYILLVGWMKAQINVNRFVLRQLLLLSRAAKWIEIKGQLNVMVVVAAVWWRESSRRESGSILIVARIWIKVKVVGEIVNVPLVAKSSGANCGVGCHSSSWFGWWRGRERERESRGVRENSGPIDKDTWINKMRQTHLDTHTHKERMKIWGRA